jgi:acetyl-CoA C-acetyltransferase
MAGEAAIIDGVRTPRGKGKPNGALHGIHPQELLAQVLTALAGRTGIDSGDVEDVVIGNDSHAGDHANDIARMAVLAAGWPIEAPGVTLNRFCGSGQQAVMYAAMGSPAGWQQLVVAGGVESMSRYTAGLGAPLDGGNQRPREQYPLVPQGISADLIATLEGFGRDDVDAYAARSLGLVTMCTGGGLGTATIIERV